MRVERYLRLIAGTFVLLSLLLARFHSEYWLLFTGFVGLNLLQSGFTNWCPMKSILKWTLCKDENEPHGVGQKCLR
ncbi:MAG: DUF2892 domain-containing protein [Thermodesulfobacteriota bacterium]